MNLAAEGSLSHPPVMLRGLDKFVSYFVSYFVQPPGAARTAGASHG